MSTISALTVSDQFQAEHADLARRVEEWRDWWEELRDLGLPHFNEMGYRLYQFREALAEHMRHEETAPRLRELARLVLGQEGVAGRLWEEHEKLLKRLDEIIERLRACTPSYACWGEARDDFERWLIDLQDHEEREIQWMQRLSRS
jgi:hypothetical protein